MKFSTRAEYGLKAIINLAKDYPLQKNLRSVAYQEKISPKYLERIMGELRKNKLVTSTKGKFGGYVLERSPQRIRIGEVIEILEGPIAPMRCIGQFCAQKKYCVSSTVWDKVGEQLKKTLYAIKLSDLIKPYEE